MNRLTYSVVAGFLFGLVLCAILVVMRGLREGWDNVRITNPPVPEAVYYLILSALQSGFAWIILGRAPASNPTPRP